MHYRSFIITALAAGLINPAFAQSRNGNKNGQQGGQSANNNNNNSNNGANSNNNANNNGGGSGGNLCLNQDVISTGSEADGQGAAGSDAGQAASATSNNNFIDFCQGKTITNGQQNKAGSCNPIPQGDIPAVGNMVSTVITSPQAGEDIAEDQTFTVTMQTQNLQAGSFTNPDVTYFSAPQQLNGQGITIGHAHVSIQDMGGTMNPAQPLDPQKFAFFKGINDDGNGKGTLSATVTGGLPAGCYRVCTIMSSSNHLGVISPVAQRGVQDDCQKFTVGKGGGGNNAQQNGQNNGQANGQANGQNNGKANGQSNGQANGQQNGKANGQNTGQNSGQTTGQNNGQNNGQRGGQQGANGNGANNANSNANKSGNTNGKGNGNDNGVAAAAAESVTTTFTTATEQVTAATTTTTEAAAAQVTGDQTATGGNGGGQTGGGTGQQGGQTGENRFGHGGRFRGSGGRRLGRHKSFMERVWVV